MFNKKDAILRKKSDSFSSITLGILSPEQILERSYGEILKPEIDQINEKGRKPCFLVLEAKYSLSRHF